MGGISRYPIPMNPMTYLRVQIRKELALLLSEIRTHGDPGAAERGSAEVPRTRERAEQTREKPTPKRGASRRRDNPRKAQVHHTAPYPGFRDVHRAGCVGSQIEYVVDLSLKAIGALSSTNFEVEQKNSRSPNHTKDKLPLRRFPAQLPPTYILVAASCALNCEESASDFSSFSHFR
jgi:hypothetical protein